jgi:hypothetical protein
MQKFSFQDMENSQIKTAADRTVLDPEDLNHEDKLPRNTHATSAVGKASSSRHFIQDWSDDDSDGDCQMYICPTPLVYAFLMPYSAIPDEEVIDAAPLNQGPPPAGIRISQKRGVKPQPEPTHKRQKIGVPLAKK